MKWSSRTSRRIDYSKIALILFVVALVLLLAMMFTLLAPKTATGGDIVNFRVARRMAAVALPLDNVTTRASAPIAIVICEITAYSPTVAECDASPLVTASGKRVYVGGIAADLRVLPFGSIVIIPNYNNGDPCTVIDTGGAIRGLKLDVFLWSTEEAIHWGRRKNVRVEVLYIPKGMP
jgi:3D (Asp-Asp-Asp) domain-containing protein